MKEQDFIARLNSLYAQYREVVKPLLAEVEASFEKFPIPMYNEVRSFSDHISKCFSSKGFGSISDAELTIQLEKAEHHIKRMILDCYKALNISSKMQIEAFEKDTKRLDLRMIDNDGNFSSEYYRLKSKAITQVAEAKKLEAYAEDINVYEAFQQAHNTYSELLLHIDKHRSQIKAAKVKFYSGKLGWIIWSLITFIIGCIITNNNAQIIEKVLGFLKIG